MQSPPEQSGSSRSSISETFWIDKLGSIDPSTTMCCTIPLKPSFFEPAERWKIDDRLLILPYRMMGKRDEEITIREDDLEIGAHIESELLHALGSVLPQASNTSFVLSAKGPDGSLIGGLTASTSYGWLLIKTLWVAEAFRRRGLGQHFVAEAEEKARSIGCHGAWLDTSNPAAMHFYEEQGYACFGQLANAADQPPANHRRWFMKKLIS